MRNILSFVFIGILLQTTAQKSTEAFSCYQSKKHSYKALQSTNDTRSDSIDIIHTAIHLDMSDWSSRSVIAMAELEIQGLVNNVNTLRIDLQGISVDSIIQNGQSLSYNHNDTLLVIDLASNLSTTQSAKVQIHYSGTPYQNPSDWGGFYWNSTYAFNIGVSFLEDPHNYGRVWFPCFDNFVERSTFEFHITTDNSRKAFCNGLLTSEEDNLDGTITWHWEMNQEIPSYLASVAVSNYATVEMDYNGIQGAPIPIVLAARPNDTTVMKGSFIHLTDAMECYENFYAPYAFDRIGYCLTSFNAGAMEHATNIAYMRAAINGTTSQETLMAHELSHHWWGDLITCEDAEDMWLNEGWASFSEALFTEYVYGEEAYKEYSRDNHDDVLRLTHVSDGGYYPVSGVPTELTYSSTVYDKGADMAHTIRGILGESDFSTCIEDFLVDYSFQDVSSELLESYLSACSGKDLSSFFETWIFEKGFHHYSIKDLNITPQGNMFLVEGSIKQKLWENSNYTTYLPMTVTFFKNMGESLSFEVSTYGPCSSFSIELPFEPVYYALDLEEKIQDATVDKYEVISTIGTHDFDLSRVIFDVSEIGDSILMHTTHHYIQPDPFQTPIPGLHLSPNRYWSVGGVWNDDFKTNAVFRYNGSNNSTSGYLDNDFITNSEDSLVILYKANQQDDWSFVDSFELNTQGSVLNKTGFFEVFNAKQGDYVMAIYDSQKPNDNEVFESCLFTGLYDVNRLSELVKIYPIPTKDVFKVEFTNDRKSHLIVKVHSILGKQVYNTRVKDFETSIDISSKEWGKGHYIVSIYDDINLVYSQKILLD